MTTLATAALSASALAQANQELIQENGVLREQMRSFLKQAHDNQRIMSRHQNFNLELIGANSFRELVEAIFSTLASSSDLDVVSLTLIDHQNNLRSILQDLSFELGDFPQLVFVANQAELALPAETKDKPTLGLYSASQHASFFSSCPKKPISIALVPLFRQKRLIGCLNLGSFHASRFSPNMATDFIEQMGFIIATCLENVINHERLTYIGLTDPLTNVSNRRNVERRMLEEIARARRQRYSIACMYLDIDFFKQVNDQYGHQSGDDVLKEVASRIKAELRLSDTLGRFGGEEFVVLLVNTDLQAAAQVAERIRLSIASTPFFLSMSGVCQSTISIGISALNPSDNQGDADAIAAELLWKADRALYDAKEQGRNRVCLAN